MNETPRLSAHARARCAEMQIKTRTAKRIVQHATLTYATKIENRVMMKSAEYPGYAVCVDVSQTPVKIITIVFDEVRQYVRRGATYEVIRG